MHRIVTRFRDRQLLAAAVSAQGDELGLAARLHVDPPAIDAWRRCGIPAELRPAVADARDGEPAAA